MNKRTNNRTKETSPSRQRCVLIVFLRKLTLALDLEGQTDEDIVSNEALKYPNDLIHDILAAEKCQKL